MKYATLLLVFFQVLTLTAQDDGHFKCATDEMHERLYQQFPSIVPGAISAYEQLKLETANYVRSSNRSGDPYIIPVVFHVIHNYGPENISDAQILDGVRQANIQLRKQNADTSDIVAAFQGIAADTEIELRIAQLDPDGNCTSGITRHVSNLTYIGDHEVKSIVQWPPDQYLNVYVCNQAAGLAGHALLPHAADTVPQWDGIVMQHSYVGTIGTSNFFRRTVLTHEIGHYLNLQHIWGGNNVPNYYYLPVAQSSNCDYDDEVDDTPLTIGWQSCNLSGNSCSSLDNVQNYMDYAYCALMFTEGQRDRMQACLNSTIAGRNNLWSVSNLAATGTDGLTNYLCDAKFNSAKRIVCVNEPVEFFDVSYHGVTARNWEVNGAQLSSSTDSIIFVTFPTPGVYSVTLTVGNGVDEITRTEEDWMIVLPETAERDFMIEGFESIPDFEQRWMVVENGSPIAWEISSPGNNSDHSIFIENYNSPAGVEYIFQSQPIDASGMNPLGIQFDYAYTKKEATNNDLLQVQLSIDCGDSWVTRRTLTATAMESPDGPTANYYTPAPSHWQTNLVEVFSSQFLVDGLLVRFRFNSGGGNNIYLDNINIGNLENLSLIHHSTNNPLLVYPNPSRATIEISTIDAEIMESMVLVDSRGRSVMNVANVLSDKLQVDISDFASGIYWIQVQTKSGVYTHKLIKE